MRTTAKVLFAAFAVGLLAMPAWAQDSARTLDNAIAGYESAAHESFQGIPTDWSTRHVIFSKPAPGSDAEDKIQQDPRYWLQQIQRAQASSDEAVENEAQTDDLVSAWDNTDKKKVKKPKKVKVKKTAKIKQDWSYDLGSGGTVGAGNFPAKYALSSTTINCISDFVVFNTSLTSSITQAAIVGFTNIYSGCGGTVPSISWAYNTGGDVQNSPILSADGSQVAFVETVGTAAHLILLKWNPGPTGRGVTGSLSATSPNVTITSGTFTQADVGAQISGTGITGGDTISAVLSSTTANLATAPTAHASEALTISAETVAVPGVPPTVAAGSYRGCTAPCMANFTFNGIANDTNSSPYYDFVGDNLYVGDNAGNLHKFSGVFHGATPAEVLTNWPTNISNDIINSPVYDSVSGDVFDTEQNTVGGNGTVLRVSGGVTPGTAVATTRIAHGEGLIDTVLVDSSAARIYAFSPDDTIGGTFSSVYQFTTTYASGNAGTVSHVGTGTGGAVPIFSGTFDNIYFTSANSATPSGNLYVCGNAGGNATLYRVPIALNVMNGTSSAMATALSTANVSCSPVTEFLPSTASTDLLFLSVTASGNTAAAIGCPATGCAVSFNVFAGTTPTATVSHVGAAGGTSGIVIDNNITSSPSGGSQVYFSTLANGTSACATSGGTGGCAVQASQASLAE
jgi:hypothetical protein